MLLKENQIYFKELLAFLLKCFLLVFPPGCHNFVGPHSLPCLTHVFENAGCSESGDGNPSNIRGTVDFEKLQSLNLKYFMLLLQQVYNTKFLGVNLVRFNKNLVYCSTPCCISNKHYQALTSTR